MLSAKTHKPLPVTVNHDDQVGAGRQTCAQPSLEATGSYVFCLLLLKRSGWSRRFPLMGAGLVEFYSEL